MSKGSVLVFQHHDHRCRIIRRECFRGFPVPVTEDLHEFTTDHLE